MMNKYEFLTVLRERLAGLPREDIERSIDYYSEMINDRMEDGMEEADAVCAIGSVEEIVSQILQEVSLPKLIKTNVGKKRALKTWEIVLLILGSPILLPLLLAAACVTASLYAVIWALIASLYAVDISFAACAVAGIFGTFTYISYGQYAQGVLFFGVGLICAGIAILLFFSFNRIAKGVLILGQKILLGIKACFIRKGEVQ